MSTTHCASERNKGKQEETDRRSQETSTDAGQGLDDHPLVFETAAWCLKDVQEDFLEEDLNLHLQMLFEAGKQGQEDGQRKLKHLVRYRFMQQ